MASMTDGAPDHGMQSPTHAQNGTSTSTPASSPPPTLPALLPTPPVSSSAPTSTTSDSATSLPSPTSAPATIPSAASSPAGTAPCQTLYIHHLNEKTPLVELRKSLYLLFSQFGHVLHVSAARTDTTRGQAWVVMAALDGAVRAVSEMDGLLVYGRPMKVEYAREESDVARRARGEVVAKREKRKRVSTAERKAAKVAALDAAAQQQQQHALQHAQLAAASLPPGGAPLPLPGYPPLGGYGLPVPMLPPNRVLFVEQLPAAMTVAQLSALWAGQAGLVECRLVGVRPGVAFVEFVGEVEAMEAMRRMQGLKVEDGHEMRISYAKK